MGDFETSREYAILCIELWRSEAVQCPVEQLEAHVNCLCYQTVAEWHLGEIGSCQTMTEAIALAKELNDTHALAMALFLAATLGYCERDPAKVGFNRTINAAQFCPVACGRKALSWLGAQHFW